MMPTSCSASFQPASSTGKENYGWRPVQRAARPPVAPQYGALAAGQERTGQQPSLGTAIEAGTAGRLGLRSEPAQVRAMEMSKALRGSVERTGPRRQHETLSGEKGHLRVVGDRPAPTVSGSVVPQAALSVALADLLS